MSDLSAEERATESDIDPRIWDIWYLEAFNALPDKARAAISLHQWRVIGNQFFAKAIRQAKATAARKAREEEREACAEACDMAARVAEASTFDYVARDADIHMAKTLAKAIRARSDSDET